MDSALIRALVPARRDDWGNTEELLATVAEVGYETFRVVYAANSKEGTTIPGPLRIPRPGKPVDTPVEQRKATPEEMRRFFLGSAQYAGG